MNVAFFLSGMSAATFLFAGVFFLKFWRSSSDKFFLYFSIACWMLSIERVALVVADFIDPQLTLTSEAFSFIYLIRMSAFVIIFLAVYKKNREASIQNKNKFS